MTLGRRYHLIVPFLLVAMIFPAIAYAKAPSQAHIRFRVPSTVTPLQTAGPSSDYVQAVLYWKPGASKTAGVSCCTSRIIEPRCLRSRGQNTGEPGSPSPWATEPAPATRSPPETDEDGSSDRWSQTQAWDVRTPM